MVLIQYRKKRQNLFGVGDGDLATGDQNLTFGLKR